MEVIVGFCSYKNSLNLHLLGLCQHMRNRETCYWQIIFFWHASCMSHPVFNLETCWGMMFYSLKEVNGSQWTPHMVLYKYNFHEINWVVNFSLHLKDHEFQKRGLRNQMLSIAWGLYALKNNSKWLKTACNQTIYKDERIFCVCWRRKPPRKPDLGSEIHLE